jgi:hypothetical protein
VDWQRSAVAWAERHGGYDPRRAPPAVLRWQQLAYRVGGALAAMRVRAATVTVVGLALVAVVPYAAGRGGIWSLLAAALVVAGVFANTVDTAVGLQDPRTSRLAVVREAVAARLAEVAWLIAFWVVGVAGPVVVACGLLTWLQEYLRAQALVAGASRITVHTLGDRPTRAGAVVTGLALAGLAGPDLAAGILTVATAVWLLLGLLGFSQLAGAVRRSRTLRRPAR